MKIRNSNTIKNKMNKQIVVYLYSKTQFINKKNEELMHTIRMCYKKNPERQKPDSQENVLYD